MGTLKTQMKKLTEELIKKCLIEIYEIWIWRKWFNKFKLLESYCQRIITIITKHENLFKR